MRNAFKLFFNRRTQLCAGGLLLGLGIGAALCIARQRRNFSFYNRVVVITGGSRGLGLVLARTFAREGARLAILARKPDELRRAQADLISLGAEVMAVPCDLRNEDEVEEAFRIIAEQLGCIDVLVNNAGVIQVGPLEHMTVADFEEALDVHLFGAMFATFAALPYMRAAKSGRIVNIASVGGKIGVPHMLPYVVSKAALVGFSDGLRSELRRHNIFVTTVCPGMMRTGSPPNALFKGRHRREYAWFAISDSLPLLSMDVRRAAQRIVEACRRGSARLVLGVHTKAAVLLNEIFPGTTASILGLANRVLPRPAEENGTKSHTGWESESGWAPSILTRATEKAAAENNECVRET